MYKKLNFAELLIDYVDAVVVYTQISGIRGWSVEKNAGELFLCRSDPRKWAKTLAFSG